VFQACITRQINTVAHALSKKIKLKLKNKRHWHLKRKKSRLKRILKNI
jgi:hypothetical protein